MVSLHGHTADSIGHRPSPWARHPRTAQVLARLPFILSLLIAAGAGAAAVGLLQPRHTGSVETHAVAVVVPTAIAIRHVTPPVPPLPPLRAIMAGAGGQALPNGSWLASHTVELRVTLAAAGRSSQARAEVEVAPAGAPFTGRPNAFSATIAVAAHRAERVPVTVSSLQDGQMYHWRARTSFSSGLASAWRGGGVFGVSLDKPMPPALAVTNVRVDGWTQISHPLFRWIAGSSVAPVAYYEYRLQQAATAPGQAVPAWVRIAGQVLVLPEWPEGQWQLAVRSVDQAGNRSEVASWGFGLQRHAPPAPQIVAAKPAEGGVTNALTPTARLAVPAMAAPIDRIEYSVAPAGSTSPDWTPLHGTTLKLPGLVAASWTVRVRAVDMAGNISKPTLWRFTVDRESPYLSAPIVSMGTFTEPVQSEKIRIGLGKPATITYAVFATHGHGQGPVAQRSLGRRPAGPVRGIAWDGKVGLNKVAPAGSYYMIISATDEAGNQTLVRSGGFTVLNKRIVISINKEALWAYEGNKRVTYTLVTNGGPDTPTVPGIYHVEAKDYKLVMHSPWPKSSPLWYPPSPTNYALLYNADGGYFLHDAPWRWHFGPGSNSVAGQPGGSYTGTHGCTNVPYDIMQMLYNWADEGTLIQIVN